MQWQSSIHIPTPYTHTYTYCRHPLPPTTHKTQDKPSPVRNHEPKDYLPIFFKNRGYSETHQIESTWDGLGRAIQDREVGIHLKKQNK